ncbi:MAG: ATP-binding protein [Candidatus Woesearchaeota archaeon]
MDHTGIFKLVINEFHKRDLPSFKFRDQEIPEIKKVISITGSRRSGKTYFFYQKISELLDTVSKDKIIYIDLSDERLYPLKLHDLQYILEAYFELFPRNKTEKIYLFLDEVQEVDGWERFIRRIYDTENASIFITGSSSKLLHKEIHTSLRGRALNYTMFPLSFKEFLRFKDVMLEKNFQYSDQRYIIKKRFNEYLSDGGFPEITINKQKRELLENYMELIIYKDIIERYHIRNLALIKNMIKYLLTNISSLFSVNSYHKIISKEMAVKQETISEYLSYLEDSFVVFTVNLFSYSLKKQQANPKKIYCIDNGLRNVVSFKFSKDEGRLAENMAFVDLKRRGSEVFYWRGKGEVDFIVKNKDNSLTAINISYTNEIAEREISALRDFKKEFKKTKGLLVLTKDLEKKENGIVFVPLWKWLLR